MEYPLIPLGKNESIKRFVFTPFPFAGASDFVFDLYGTFYYPPFYAATFPFLPPFCGPFPYGFPPFPDNNTDLTNMR
ncbi:hypothetical protein [Pontibacillus litoralis]|uniref:Uncharacterized protein n=1 Tax=Pontibacillus litoralis JSM 072002 TaxID=1385512 RepID=A0A0A5G398_9BACI|nr:hypothetical protein [Pontibacillus litoralis]KGX87586.1 hypothetical protein N784_15170 [Pontibacillus litoralis JSM 072002]